MLVWLPVIFSALGVVIAAIAFFASRSTRSLDAEQLAQLKREQKNEAEEKAEQLDERRRREDDSRTERLRDELNALSRLSNERFGQWREAEASLDELWSYVEDEVVPYMRKSYNELREFGSEITAPPQPPRRRRVHD